MRALERDKLIFRNLMNHCIMALQPQEWQEKEQSMELTLMHSGLLNKGLRLRILEHNMRVQVMSHWYDVYLTHQAWQRRLHIGLAPIRSLIIFTFIRP